MLKEHPLSQMSIAVTINSSQTLGAITSSTHAIRKTQTPHSARVDFSAKDYSPQSDFELEIPVEVGRNNLEIVPYQAASDGYFLLKFSPPMDKATPASRLLPPGSPVNLLILADTSGSMNAEARKAQALFLAATLASLGPQDRFDLATCDTAAPVGIREICVRRRNQHWTGRDFLAAQRWLGWTDLDKTVAAVLPRITARTHVIYIGDGIVSAGDADAAAFAER